MAAISGHSIENFPHTSPAAVHTLLSLHGYIVILSIILASDFLTKLFDFCRGIQGTWGHEQTKHACRQQKIVAQRFVSPSFSTPNSYSLQLPFGSAVDCYLHRVSITCRHPLHKVNELPNQKRVPLRQFLRWNSAARFCAMVWFVIQTDSSCKCMAVSPSAARTRNTYASPTMRSYQSPCPSIQHASETQNKSKYSEFLHTFG